MNPQISQIDTDSRDPRVEKLRCMLRASGSFPFGSVNVNPEGRCLLRKKLRLGAEGVDLPDIRHYDYGCAGGWNE